MLATQPWATPGWKGRETGTHETDKAVGKAKIRQGEKDFQGPVIYTQEMNALNARLKVQSRKGTGLV